MYFEINMHVSLTSIEESQKASEAKLTINTYISCICVMQSMELLKESTFKIKMKFFFSGRKAGRNGVEFVEHLIYARFSTRWALLFSHI